MFKGDNPRSKEDAAILNDLLELRRRGEKIEGLLWLLGTREYYAAMNVEPGSLGVSYDSVTQTLELFGLPVLRVHKDRYARIVKPIEYKNS